uniref:Sec1-like protein n=1 Tax=Vannella robusta TaxID=1487602 RepID=A0A7S4M7C2_9EUKA
MVHMDVIVAIQRYIQLMIESVKGMKVLILDHETMGIVSSVFSQNEILQQEVYLFELIDTPNREVMTHLKSICFLRPTQENLFLLSDELKKPKYEQYHLFYTNVLKADYLEELAHADEHEVVTQVQEYYADYFPIHNNVFSFNIDTSVALSPTAYQNTLDRTCDGLSAILLSLKRKPLIRYEKSSTDATKIAQELVRRMNAKEERSLFDFGRKAGGVPVLLIIDRRSDPITPLLTQWTYQAMVHELMGIRNNRVNTGSGEIVLSALQDDFFKANLFANYGDLGENVKRKAMEAFEQGKRNQNIQSIEDMKNFLQNYPEFQKLSSNASKHVNMLTDLSSIVSSRHLYPVSEAEQELAVNSDHSFAVKTLTPLLSSPKVGDAEKLRLLLLYAVRYENHSANQLGSLMNMVLNSSSLDKQETVGLIKTMLLYGGEGSRSGDLFGNKNWFAKAKSSIKRGLKEATNVYTQHKPMLAEHLNELVRGKLSEVEYPAIEGKIDRNKPSDIIVFIAGGATYEESVTLREAKDLPEFANVRIVLGGSSVLNSSAFLKELARLRDSNMRN